MHPNDLPQPSAEHPHPDSDKTGRPAYLQNFLGWLVTFLLGILLLIGLGAFLSLEVSPASKYLVGMRNVHIMVFWIFAVLLRLPAIWWHELGHAVASRLLGWKLLSFYALPFVIYRDGRRWRATLHSNEHAAGGVTAIPPDWRAELKAWQDAIISLGGPLASLLLLPLAAGLEHLFGWAGAEAPALRDVIFGIRRDGSPNFILSLVQEWSPFVGFVGVGIWLLALHGVFDAVFNLIPRRFGPHRSDGAALLVKLRRDKTWRHEADVCRFLAMFMSDDPVTGWDADLLERLAESESVEWRVSALGAAYDRAVARGDADAARSLLTRALRQLPELPPDHRFYATLALEAAHHYAAYEGDWELAYAWFEHVEGQLPDVEHRPRAALLLLEGNYDEAIRQVELAERFFEAYPPSSMLNVELDQLTALRNRAQAERDRKDHGPALRSGEVASS